MPGKLYQEKRRISSFFFFLEMTEAQIYKYCISILWSFLSSWILSLTLIWNLPPHNWILASPAHLPHHLLGHLMIQNSSFPQESQLPPWTVWPTSFLALQTSPPPSISSGLFWACFLWVASQPARKRKLRANASHLRRVLRKAGAPVVGTGTLPFLSSLLIDWCWS